MNRRQFLTTSTLAAAATPQLLRADHHKATAIGSRRELFIENSLIESFNGAEQRLHHPVPQEIAIQHDAPWEGTGCGYHSVFHDGEKYRMYYKAWHIEVSKGNINTGRHPLYCCYAESDDGITWRKPNLGVDNAVGSEILGAFASDPFDRRGGLHHAHGVGERLQVQGEVLAVGAPQHPCGEFVGIGGGEIGVAGVVGKLDDRRGSQPAVEMVVEQDLGGSADALERGGPDVRAVQGGFHTPDYRRR